MTGSVAMPLLKMSSPEFQVDSCHLNLKCIGQKRCQKSGALVLSMVSKACSTRECAIHTIWLCQKAETGIAIDSKVTFLRGTALCVLCRADP